MFPPFLSMPPASSAAPPVPYRYVVGPNGNYPATPAGLQAAINAAGSNPIFVDKSFTGTSPSVTVGADTKIFGAVNENPAGTFTFYTGIGQFDISTTNNTTVISCPLLLPSTPCRLTLENICYAPDGVLFNFTPSTGGNTTVTLNNCKAVASTGTPFAITVSTNVAPTIVVKLSNTSLGDQGNQVLCPMTNTGADSLSAIYFRLYVTNGSFVSTTDPSELTGYGINFFLNVWNSYFASQFKYISGAFASIYLSLANCMIGESGYGNPLLQGTFANLYIDQMQDVTFIYSTDYIGAEVPIIKDLPTNLVGSFSTLPQNISFVNCKYSAVAAVLAAFTAVAANYTLSADHSVNSPKGNFTTLTPNTYAYVVGPTGNYPQTQDGLQAAMNDASAAADGIPFSVFIQPGVVTYNNSGNPIIVPDGCYLVGSVSEYPPNAIDMTEGEFTINTDFHQAVTRIEAPLQFDDVNGTYGFYNICWAGDIQTFYFFLNDGDGTQTFNLKDSWVCQNGSSGTIGGFTNHHTGTMKLVINLDHSVVNVNSGYLSTIAVDNGSIGEVIINASNNSLVAGLSGTYSDIENVGAVYTLNFQSGSMYIDWIAIVGAVVLNMNLNGCIMGMFSGISLVDQQNAGLEFNLYQQDVQWINPNPSVDSYIFNSAVGLNVVNAINDQAHNIQLINAHWCNDNAVSATVLNSIAGGPIRIPALTAAGTFVLPKNTYIDDIIINNTTANAVTGGIKIGTTLGGTDVVTALAVGANATVYANPTGIAKRVFTVDTTLYIDAVAAFNSASLNISVPLTSNVFI